MSSRGKGLLVFMLVILVAGALVAGCLPQAPAAKPAKVETVKAGFSGYVTESPIFVAAEKYAAEQGIKVEFEQFRSGADMIAPLTTGDLHIGVGTAGVGLFNAVARGVDIKVVATMVNAEFPYESNWIVVRSDLKDQIKTPADLKGRTVNLLPPGTVAYPLLGMVLEKHGLSLKDIKIENIGPAETAAAFQRKAIDVSFSVEPIPTVLQEQGIAYKWLQPTQFAGPTQIAAVMYSGPWARQNKDLASRSMVAYLKGLRAYYRAALGQPDRAEVVAIATKYTAMKEPAQYEKITWSKALPDGNVDVASLKQQQDWFIKNGFQTDKADIDKLVDNTYLDYAIGKLGKFK